MRFSALFAFHHSSSKIASQTMCLGYNVGLSRREIWQLKMSTPK